MVSAPAESMCMVLSIPDEVSDVVVVVDSVFLVPHPSAAKATVSARRATIAKARIFRIVILFTSSRSPRRRNDDRRRRHFVSSDIQNHAVWSGFESANVPRASV